MKTTKLWQLREDVVWSCDYDDNRIVMRTYARSPSADELIAVSEEERVLDAPLPWDLLPIGVLPRNPFYIIHSRADCGSFWRLVAIAKYRFLVTEHWIKNQLFRHLYQSGMMIHPTGEVPLWKHIRLDWQILLHLSYLVGAAILAVRAIADGNYSTALLNSLLVLQGCFLASVRRKRLIELRDRELREISLRSLFRLHGITPTENQFQACLFGWGDPDEIIAQYQRNRSIQQQLKATNPCYYYGGEGLLRCAVHPEHYGLGMCNTKCPSFWIKDNQQKI